jgi:hypothetical protein
MYRAFESFVIKVVLVIIEWSVKIIVHTKDYGVRVWENNVMRKLAFETLALTLAQFSSFVSYLKEIEMHLRCRIAYTKITKPMKLHYRELIQK